MRKKPPPPPGTAGPSRTTNTNKPKKKPAVTTATGSSSSSVQLNFKNHCLFCLRRQTPQQIYEVVFVNPKKIENFQPIINYLTGTDPTIGKWETECKAKNIPTMGNLPPMCLTCYDVFGELYKLHMQLQKLQALIQEQTLKGRRIVGENVRGPAIFQKSFASRRNFYQTLKEEGMSEVQFEVVKKFVDNLHDLISTQGPNEVKYPAHPDLLNGQPRKIPGPVILEKPSTATATPAPPINPSGILIPVRLVQVPDEDVTVTSISSPCNSTSSVPASASGNSNPAKSSPPSTTNLKPPPPSFKPSILRRSRVDRIPISSSKNDKDSNSNSTEVEELIDLCDDDDIKPVKEEEEHEMEQEEEEAVKPENDEGIGEDEDNHPLNDPLCSPEPIHEEDENESDDGLERKVPLEVLIHEGSDEDDDSKNEEDPLTDNRNTKSKRLPTSLSSVQSVLTTTPTSAPLATNVFTVAGLQPSGSRAMTVQYLPVVANSLFPSYIPLMVKLPDPLAPDVVEKPEPVPKPKRVRKRKPRVKKVRERKPRKPRKVIRKASLTSPYFQRCDMCNEIVDRDEMKGHMKSHIGKDGITCPICNRTFATKRSYFYHTGRGSGEHTLKCMKERRKLTAEFFSPTCTICHESIHAAMESFRMRRFYIHLFSVHETDTSLEESHNCSLCGSKFRTENGLDFHINEHIHERRKKMMVFLTSVADLRIEMPNRRFGGFPGCRIANRLKKVDDNELSESGSSIKFWCSECPGDGFKDGKLFDSQEALDQHTKQEHKPKQCKLCEDYSYTRHATYMFHLRDRHAASTKPCDICWNEEGKEADYLTLSKLRAHYFDAHGIGKKMGCDSCNKYFFCRNALTTHSRAAHGTDIKSGRRQRQEAFADFMKNMTEEERRIWNARKMAEPRFVKRRLRATANEGDLLKKETNTDQGKEKEVLQCEFCLQGHVNRRILDKDKLYSEARLRLHIQNHHHLKCQGCEADFVGESDLIEHETTHHPELRVPLDCPTCSRTIVGQHNLKLHMARHLNPYRGFPCPICPRKFKSYVTMYNHKFVHSTESPYVCDSCGRRFKQKRLLTSHRKIHLPGGRPKPFTCEFCGKRYGDKIYMLRHIKAHHPTDDGDNTT